MKEFIAQYELLYSVQDAMRCRIRDIFVHGIVEDQRKKFFDAIYQIEVERIKRANKGLYEYN